MAASRDIRTLERRLNKIASALTENVEALVADVIESIGDELTATTPVLTGFAVANWRPSLNVPVTSPVAFLDPSRTATAARIATVASRYRVGDVAYIRNNIDYIAALNNGSSPKAPKNFVAKATRAGRERAFAQRKALTAVGA